MDSILRRVASKFKGRLIHTKSISCPYVFLGSKYGGWPVIKDSLDENSVVLSFGLGRDITFDLEVVKTFNCSVIGFDPTPRSIDWLKKQVLPEKFSYHQIGIAAEDGQAKFYPPDDEEHVSFSSQPKDKVLPIHAPVKRLTTIMKELKLSKVDALKMDIEGFEYSVLEDMMKNDVLPHQLLVEFHHTMYGIDAAQTREIVSKLISRGYEIFYVSDVGLEYGFKLAS